MSILLNIPIELRCLIIDFVADKGQSSPRIPCCKNHTPYDDSWGWHRNANEQSIIPASVQDILSLARVNHQLHAEVTSTFYKGV